jgi:hypothetical protein
MPRSLALPALLALLAAGCAGEPCTAPALTVAWRFDTAEGVRDAGCADVGVTQVRIYDGSGRQLGQPIACDQGAVTFLDVPAGAYDLTVEGRSASGALVNRDWFRQEVGACGETRVLARPGQGYLLVDYDTTTGACDTAGLPGAPSYMWFWLLDTATNSALYGISSGSGSADKVLYPCLTTPLTLLVPYGAYRLDWIHNVRDPLGRPNAAYQFCPDDMNLRPQAVVHAPGVTTLPVLLAPVTSPGCPL